MGWRGELVLPRGIPGCGSEGAGPRTRRVLLTSGAKGNRQQARPSRGLGRQLAPHTLPAQPATGAPGDLEERDIRVASAGSPDRWVEQLSRECLAAAGEG